MLANRRKNLPHYLKAMQKKSIQIRRIDEAMSAQPQTSSTSTPLMPQMDTMSNFKVVKNNRKFTKGV